MNSSLPLGALFLLLLNLFIWSAVYMERRKSAKIEAELMVFKQQIEILKAQRGRES